MSISTCSVNTPKVFMISYSFRRSRVGFCLYCSLNGFEIPEMFIGKNILHLPTQKTHGHTTITGAMKNAFGGLLTKKRHHSHKLIHEVLVDLLEIQKEIHTGIFAVVDGTVCGDGAGPRSMIPLIENYILASEDQVAIDSISAKMMGYSATVWKRAIQ